MKVSFYEKILTNRVFYFFRAPLKKDPVIKHKKLGQVFKKMSRSDPFRNDTAIIFVVLESFEAQLQAILLSGKLQLTKNWEIITIVW